MKFLSKKQAAFLFFVLSVSCPCVFQCYAAECVLHPKSPGEFGIFLLNDEIVEGGQFRVIFGVNKGVRVTDVTVTPRTAGFEVVFSQEARAVGETAWLVIFYSFQGKFIAPGKGDILTIHLAPLEGGTSFSQMIVSDIVLGGINAKKLARDGAAEYCAANSNPNFGKSLVPEPSMLIFWMMGMLMVCFSVRMMRRKQDHRRTLQTFSLEKITRERI